MGVMTVAKFPSQLAVRAVVHEERGVSFEVGSAFYRKESMIARDLGVLISAVDAQRNENMRVLDLMSGCGVRALRYLTQGGAEFVWANDLCGDLMNTLTRNLSKATQSDTERWRTTNEDAYKVLLGCAQRNEYYDLVDVDSFGSDSLCLGPALGAVRHGGLVYVTSTDGLSSGGHRPYNSLASYGAFIRPMPFANEIGLRMLIGGVVREASTRNMNVQPVFSNYSFHGPVFRAMLRVRPGKVINKHYGFFKLCSLCGQGQPVEWENLGDMSCSCLYPKVLSSLNVSGPLWTGPLHCASDVEDMIQMGMRLGWITAECGTAESRKSTTRLNMLDDLLDVMLTESHPDLPCGYIDLHEIAKRGKVQTPRRADLINHLRKEGYAASRSHVSPIAVKTTCPMEQCIEYARKMHDYKNLGYNLRILS